MHAKAPGICVRVCVFFLSKWKIFDNIYSKRGIQFNGQKRNGVFGPNEQHISITPKNKSVKLLRIKSPNRLCFTSHSHSSILFYFFIFCVLPAFKASNSRRERRFLYMGKCNMCNQCMLCGKSNKLKVSCFYSLVLHFALDACIKAKNFLFQI